MEQNEQTLPVSQQEPEEGTRKKVGAPLGNTNAAKHGLYVHHKHIRNTSPIEKATLYDLTDTSNPSRRTFRTFMSWLPSPLILRQ
jgi:hypothetical protein